MKNKLLAICLLLVYIIHICGCSNNSNSVSKEDYDKVVAELNELKAQTVENSDSESMDVQTDTENQSKDNQSEGSFNEQIALSKLKIKDYSYMSGSYPNILLEIENNSDWDLNIGIELQTFDSAENILAVKNISRRAVEHGTSTLVQFILDEKYTKMEYTLSLSEENYYSCVISDLTYISNKVKDKEIFSVTNSGTKDAYSVMGYVLFFNGNDLVQVSSSYFINDDGKLKVGETKSKEIYCNKTYDSFKVFFTGWGK